MTDSARWKATVYVGGLSPLAATNHVLDAFIPFGEIVEVKVPKNDAPNAQSPHRGFAYVEYEDSADAKEAIDNMDQSELFGKVLKVSPAKPPKSADEGLGSKTAVWEQEGWLSKNAAEEGNGVADDAEPPMDSSVPDPMQGLEGLDVAGPQPQ
ncbi:RNA recognition motif [Geosmithia morbida]|uniref:RNA recognition motif n=1 Tax=Geosmithia morbida TaxID=1094350 RepID=A0A9P5D2F2_9HYPO|nr:RNA recognition motif [Geosmithia morbida]KAF4123797.1 RNA recognition motif [Geosmithia morbida]